MDAPDTRSLPANAYIPLPPRETYRPLAPPAARLPEATGRSVGWGLLLCAIFTVASAYSGLKVGQVMEAAIPISILAIGLARTYARRSSLLENVIVTGIGGVSGALVAGAIFTLPALYILKLDPHPLQTVFICLAGGCLGVLFLIPLRRYFVREMHGELAYPEATAITEVLVTGERGGSQAKLLLQATAIAGIYDLLATTFHVWREFVDFQFVPVFRSLAERARVILSFDAVAFILGLGYVMGLRSSMILCAGGFTSNLVLVPLIWMIGRGAPDLVVYPGALPIAQMTAAQIFRGYVRFIGVGAIATTARNPVSGMTMLTIIVSSVVLLRFGLSGTTGMFFVMAIAGMVCTALSVSGQTITDLKTGYWLGSTPATQEMVKFLGVIAAALAAGLTNVLLAQTFQFGEAGGGGGPRVLSSPRAPDH